MWTGPETCSPYPVPGRINTWVFFIPFEVFNLVFFLSSYSSKAIRSSICLSWLQHLFIYTESVRWRNTDLNKDPSAAREIRTTLLDSFCQPWEVDHKKKNSYWCANVSWNIQLSIAHIFLWWLQGLFYYMHKKIWKELSIRLFERLDSVRVQLFCTCLACVGGQCASFARAFFWFHVHLEETYSTASFNLVLINKFCYSFWLIGKSIACRLVIFVDLTTGRQNVWWPQSEHQYSHVDIFDVLAARRRQRRLDQKFLPNWTLRASYY